MSEDNPVQPGPRRSPGARTKPNRFVQAAFQLLPFVMSALLYLSFMFTVFSPLPLLFFSTKASRNEYALAIFSNALLVTLLDGELRGLGFVSFVGTIVVLMPYFLLDRKYSLERVVVYTLIGIVLTAIGLFTIYGVFEGSNIVAIFQNQVQSIMTEVKTVMVDQGASPDVVEEEIGKVLKNLPSVIGIFALMMVWLNLMIFVRTNPKNIRMRLGLDRRYFVTWKAPEFLIWPTLIAAALGLLTEGLISTIGVNFFRFFMAAYAIQGLSVASFFFDQWNIRGVFRTILIIFLVWPMLPLLLAVGFFDLWFDFRAKFGQT